MLEHVFQNQYLVTRRSIPFGETDLSQLPASLKNSLKSLFAATEILSPDSFRVGDLTPVTVGRRRLPMDGNPSPQDRPTLESALAETLYWCAYCHPQSGWRNLDAVIPKANDPIYVEDRAFSEDLIAASTTEKRWDPDWVVYDMTPDGGIWARKGVRCRHAASGAYALPAPRTGRIQPGIKVSLPVAKYDRTTQQSFVRLMGNTLSSDYDMVTTSRFYFNVKAENAVRLVALIVEALNTYHIPFMLKTLSNPKAYGRADSMVLYVAKRFVQAVSLIFQEIFADADDLRRSLNRPVPFLTRALAPGIGFAEDPGNGNSFGQSRCTLIASGLVQAWYQGVQGDPDRQFDIVARRFAEEGYSLARPHLRPNSVDLALDLKRPPQQSTKGPAKAQAASPKRPMVRPEKASPSPAAAGDTAAVDGLEAAGRIGAGLVQSALWHKDQCNWFGWSIKGMGANTYAAYSSMDGSFYGGGAGIAYFLGHLYKFWPDPLVLKTINGALTHSHALGQKHIESGSGGLYSGASGVAHSLLSVGRILGDQRWIDKGLALMNRCKAYPCQPEFSDLMGGLAGSVIALVTAGLDFDRDDFIDAAVKQSEQLLAMAVEDQFGLSWPGVGPSSHNLLGYSHGVSGYAAALLEAGQAAHRQDLIDAAFKALKTEQALYDPDQANWPDFRGPAPPPGAPKTGREPPHMIAWCHGAVGIAVARWRHLALRPDDDAARQDWQIALETTRAGLRHMLDNPISDFGLCHGLFGSADALLLAAGPKLDDYRPIINEAAALGFHKYSRTENPWPCGGRMPGEAPGLMLGLAGIGQFYLRLHDSTEVPSPLVVHPVTSPKKPTASTERT